MSKKISSRKQLKLYVHGEVSVTRAELDTLIRAAVRRLGLLPYANLPLAEIILQAMIERRDGANHAADLRGGVSSLNRTTDELASKLSSLIDRKDLTAGYAALLAVISEGVENAKTAVRNHATGSG